MKLGVKSKNCYREICNWIAFNKNRFISLCLIIKNHAGKPLSYYVNKKIEQTLHRNNIYQANKLSFLEKSISIWSTHYFKYILELITFFILLAIFLFQTIEYITPFLKNNEYIEESWYGLILAGQITIIGLIYPLVISLVSVLFQNKSGGTLLFHLYQKFSGFMFSGLSGLILSLLLTIAIAFQGTAFDVSSSNELNFVIHFTTTIWFMFNLLLTIWFFVRTVGILDKKKQNDFIFRFICNEVAESDLYKRSLKVYSNSQSIKNFIVPNQFNINIERFKYGKSNNEKHIVQPTNKDKELTNISFFWLNIAIWSLNHKLVPDSDNRPSIYINPSKKISSKNHNVLITYSDLEISPLIERIFQYAFKYKDTSREADINLQSTIQTFTAPVKTALKTEDESSYSESLKNLATVHSQLAKLLSYKDSEDKVRSWLIDSKDGWGSNDLRELMWSYRQFTNDSISKLETSTRFFHYSLGFYKDIYISQKSILEQEIDQLLLNNYFMWDSLLYWKLITVDKIGIQKNYEQAINDFVSSWETWLRYYIDKDAKHEVFIHLQYTAKLIMN